MGGGLRDALVGCATVARIHKVFVTDAIGSEAVKTFTRVDAPMWWCLEEGIAALWRGTSRVFAEAWMRVPDTPQEQ